MKFVHDWKHKDETFSANEAALAVMQDNDWESGQIERIATQVRQTQKFVAELFAAIAHKLPRDTLRELLIGFEPVKGDE